MRRPSLWIVAALVSTAAAHAETVSKEDQAACRPDVRRFCSHIGSADNQKYKECLQMHSQELSQKCQQVLMKHQSQQ